VIPSKKPTAALIKADKIGKAAYNPVLKDSMGTRPTLEQVETMMMNRGSNGGKKSMF
jgi:hypothetical protein